MAVFRNLSALKWVFTLVVLHFLCGCNAKTEKIDRFECMNRAIHGFNTKADRLVVKPTVQVYEAVIPKPLRNMVSHFFQNLSEVPTVGNDLLQGNFSLAGSNTARFLLNSTWGIGGLFDIAATGGLEPRRQDFGLTLAKWGYKDSAYLVLPLLGPSTVRDGIGRFVTYEMGIPAHLKSIAWRNRLMIANYIDTRTSLLKVDPLRDEAVDEYIFVRDAYLQHRQYEIGDKEAGSVAASEANLQGPPE